MLDLTFEGFWQQVSTNPLLALAVVLTLGGILVNGWTDAPNAIATCVVTRCMSARAAIIMAGICNFLGVLIMSLLSSKVAETITKMVDFGSDPKEAVVALSAALFAIVVWATAAWFFGIPTSESHALIAGLTGSAIALHGSLEGVNGNEWVKVLYGILISVVIGFGLGWICCKGVELIFRRADRPKTEGFFRGAQIVGAGFMAFMHGAQDGQKFMGVLILSIYLVNGISPSDPELGMQFIDTNQLIWLMLICSAVMGIGTMIGGKKIIKSVGMDMVKLEKYQGFSADIAASISLLLSSVGGIPVSTTHAKTTSIMGVGAVRRLSAINLGVVKEMALTWVLTFPGCGLVGFLMTKLFMLIF